MNGKYVRLCLVVTLASITLSIAQGPLTPPGAPAPLMKTLEQIEPRTAITNVPYSITAAGSYYLADNFTGVAGTNGITILASGVVLDLNGFALTGVPGSADGVNVAASRQSIIIRNGTVRHWGGDGVDAGGSGVRNVLITDIVAVSNAAHGIQVNSLASVIQCVANENGVTGVWGSGVGVLFKNCIASFNLSRGFRVPTSSVVSDCTARDNFDDGFWLEGGCTIQNCSSIANDVVGIRVTGSGTMIVNCTATASGAEGILAGNHTYIFGNNCIFNGSAGVAAGIHITGSGSRVDSNNSYGNDIGITVAGVSNFVVRNTAGGNLSGTNYQFVAGNSFGAINNVGGVGSFSVANSWANFEY